MTLRTSGGNATSDLQWTSFTPTGSWTTNTTYSGFYRLVGTTLEVTMTATLSGAPNAVALTVDLPSGFTANTAQLPASLVGLSVGYGSVFDGAAAYPLVCSVFPGISTTALQVFFENTSGSSSVLASMTESIPSVLDSGDQVALKYDLPVTF